jgi:hypothetical protein
VSKKLYEPRDDLPPRGEFVRRHWVVLLVAALALAHWASFTWAEWGYFCDQAADHGQAACGSFWQAEHVHDWLYNYSANVLSELTFGVVLVVLVNRSRTEDEA